MKSQSDSLLENLERFELDDPAAAFPFSRRLARENGWTHEFALRVIREYKRFVYLAMRAGHPVTPSDEVDQAWHLHLCYTESYWTEMCGQVLGRPFHHGPTKGGGAENAKFHDWYGKTLESYERLFGETPPADIWPEAGRRFGRRYTRVDPATHWIVKRPTRAGLTVAAGSVGVAAILTGCSSKSDSLFYVVTGAVILLVILIVSLKRTAEKNNPPLRRDSQRPTPGANSAATGIIIPPMTTGQADAVNDRSAHGGAHHDHGHDGHDGGSGCGGDGCGGSGCGGGGCGS